MIEKMRKITLLVSEKDREDFVTDLRRAGVVHTKNIEEPVSHDIRYVEDRIGRVSKLISVLTPYAGQVPQMPAECGEEEALEMEQEILDAAEEKESRRSDIRDMKKNLEWYEGWGEFNPEDIKEIRDAGVGITLLELDRKMLKELENRIGGQDNETWLRVISGKKQLMRVAVMGRIAEDIFPEKRVSVPELAPEEIKKRIKANEEEIQRLESSLADKARMLRAVQDCLEGLFRKREYLEVKHGMREEGGFSCLQGFCPVKFTDKVRDLTRRYKAGYVSEEAPGTDETPTLITNPKWIDIIRPVFQFMNTVPGYNEFDISGVFLVFFSLFFAMLVGDGGYGLIFIAATVIARKKMPKAPYQPFFLMGVMGVATLIWGALTGTWFGSRTIARLPVFNSLIIDRISSFGDTQDFMIYLCFIIGAVQLTIARLIRAARFINSLKAVAEIGWAMTIWGMFFAAGTLVVGKPFPPAGGWLLISGITLTLFFSNPEKNPLKGALTTLTSLPLDVIGSFSDVVSYLRLFAVGYATVVLATTFNSMAAEGAHSFAGGLMAAFILFAGHTLNIILAMMAVVVHGIRLNMLEFSGHLGMQWSGKKYDPFSEQ